MKNPSLEKIQSVFLSQISKGKVKFAMYVDDTGVIYAICLNGILNNDTILRTHSCKDDYVSVEDPFDSNGEEGDFFEYNNREVKDWLIKVVTDKITKQLNKGGK